MAENRKKEPSPENVVSSGGKAGRKYSEEFKKNTIKTSEEAKRRGRAGGIKSGESKRNKRDAKDAIQYMLGLAAKGKLESNLKELGYPAEELTNMAALQARLFTLAMGGDIEAYKTLMRMAGYEPEENRKERESIASDARREREIEAKINALSSSLDNPKIALNLMDEDENNDVVIYMPEIASESSCEPEKEAVEKDAGDGTVEETPADKE